MTIAASARRAACACALLLSIAAMMAGTVVAQAVSDPNQLAATIREVQPKVVKIHGAGGFRGLESYQSGFLISPDGYIVTAWSYVLDSGEVTVVLSDGRRLPGRVMNADPLLELALLKIDAEDLPHFELAEAEASDQLAPPGAQVLAFSNLFGVATGDEPVSVQHGVVAVVTRLEARRGVFETTYKGRVYVLDAITNNPGAAGGALVDYKGRLLGMLGKELRNALSNTWLNYAIPVSEFAAAIEPMKTGTTPRQEADERQAKPENAVSLAMLGVVLVPDILERTPPFIDVVRPGTPAAESGLQPDDLVLFVNERLVQSCKALVTELEHIDRIDPVKLTVVRNEELVEVTLTAPEGTP
jgi:serine protease Do